MQSAAKNPAEGKPGCTLLYSCSHSTPRICDEAGVPESGKAAATVRCHARHGSNVPVGTHVHESSHCVAPGPTCHSRKLVSVLGITGEVAYLLFHVQPT